MGNYEEFIGGEPENTEDRNAHLMMPDSRSEDDIIICQTPGDIARPNSRAMGKPTRNIELAHLLEPEQVVVPRTSPESPNKLAEFVSGRLFTALLALIVAALCICAAAVLPSGALMAGDVAAVETRSAEHDISNGIENIMSNVVNQSLSLPKVYLLPMTESAGKKPNPAGFTAYKKDGITHYTYEDPTITVDCWKEKTRVDGTSVVINFSRVKVAHPTQVRTSFAGGKYGLTRRIRGSKIAAKVNAVVAVNGDLYNYHKYGLLYRQGTLYRSKASNQDTLLIDENGDFHIMTSNEAKKTGFCEKNVIYNSFNFGPALVIDGELQYYRTATSSGLPAHHFGHNPRTAVGQLGQLEYLLVAVEGRTYSSGGISTNDLAKIMHERGCIQAYNLDGGQSSTMYFNGKTFNEISNNGERALSEMFYFASAYPTEAWQ